MKDRIRHRIQLIQAIFHLLGTEWKFLGFKLGFRNLEWHRIASIRSRTSEGNPQKAGGIPAHELSHSPSIIEWDECTRLLVVPRSVPRTAVQTSLLASLIARIETDGELSVFRAGNSDAAPFDLQGALHSIVDTQRPPKHVIVVVEMEPPGGLNVLDQLFNGIQSFGVCAQCSRPLVTIFTLAYDTESWDHVIETFWTPSDVGSAMSHGVKILDAHCGALNKSSPSEFTCLVDSSYPVAAAEVSRLRMAAEVGADAITSQTRTCLATMTGTSKWLRPTISRASQEIASELGLEFNNLLGTYLPAALLAEALLKSDALISATWRIRNGRPQFYFGGNILLSLGMGCQVLNYAAKSGTSFMETSLIPRDLIWDFHDYESLRQHLHSLASETPYEKRRRRSSQLEWFDSVTSLEQLEPLLDVHKNSLDRK